MQRPDDSRIFAGMLSPGEKYFPFLSLRDASCLSTLGEGNTPLVRSNYLSDLLGIPETYFKLESTNPTGSFKDRIMAAEVSLMRERGCSLCLGPSTGNAGASLAAYAARFGIRCYIYATENASVGKLQQILFHGATVQRVRNFGVSPEFSESVFCSLKQLAVERGAQFICSSFRFNPLGMEAVKTISFELCEQLGQTPDSVFLPIAGGGLLSGMWKGFKEYHDLLRIDTLPRMNGVQAAGCPTVVQMVRKTGKGEKACETLIGALAAPFAPDAKLAASSIAESGGWAYDPTDEEIFAAQNMLAKKEGIYAEPIGAAPVAGLIQARRDGRVASSERVVCVITGHGFKDSESVARANQGREIPVIALNELGRNGLPEEN